MSARVVKYHEAIRLALEEELELDERVVLFGVDMGEAGHVFAAAKGVQQKFGSNRVRDTPISELGMTGCGVGAAMAGLRPIVDLLFLDFVGLAMDQIVNQAAKMRYMSAGAFSVPMTILTLCGAGMNNGPHHSGNVEAWLAAVPGIYVVMPATPADVKGMIKAAVRSDDPVVVIESLALWHQRGPVGGPDDVAELGKAATVRAGRDVTIMSVGRMLYPALEAAEMLSGAGIDAEVIDVRSLQPLDTETLCESVRRTGAAVVVHEAVKPYGVGAEIVAVLHEEVFDYLDAPVARVTPPFTHVPASPQLEAFRIPTAHDVAAAVRAIRLPLASTGVTRGAAP
jgi:pyruvate/2-oxoglutarate/acetoin dehydrogenase E1 component